VKKLIIQLWQTSAVHPELATVPFLMATTGAAMNMAVEIHAIGASVELLIKDRHPTSQMIASSGRSLHHYIEDALRSGVAIHPCSTALRLRGLDASDLIDGLGDVIGMVSMLDRATESNVTVLTY
jgi:predicted peroxiredoxin